MVSHQEGSVDHVHYVRRSFGFTVVGSAMLRLSASGRLLE